MFTSIRHQVKEVEAHFAFHPTEWLANGEPSHHVKLTGCIHSHDHFQQSFSSSVPVPVVSWIWLCFPQLRGQEAGSRILRTPCQMRRLLAHQVVRKAVAAGSLPADMEDVAVVQDCACQKGLEHKCSIAPASGSNVLVSALAHTCPKLVTWVTKPCQGLGECRCVLLSMLIQQSSFVSRPRFCLYRSLIPILLPSSPRSLTSWSISFGSRHVDRFGMANSSLCTYKVIITENPICLCIGLLLTAQAVWSFSAFGTSRQERDSASGKRILSRSFPNGMR